MKTIILIGMMAFNLIGCSVKVSQDDINRAKCVCKRFNYGDLGSIERVGDSLKVFCLDDDESRKREEIRVLPDDLKIQGCDFK